MPSITNADLSLLSSFNPHQEILGIKNVSGNRQLVVIPKSEVTCWQKFLRIFQKGALAHTHIYLRDISDYLAQYQWTTLSSKNPGSEEYKAYCSVCSLANKTLYYKFDERLYRAVSTETIDKKIELEQYQGSRLIQELSASHTFYWNPALQAKHIRALLYKHFRQSTISVKDQNFSRVPQEMLISQEALKTSHIRIRQELAEPLMVPPSIRVPTQPMHTAPTSQTHHRQG